MCFTIDIKHPKKKIARKDKICYKLVTKINSKTFKPLFYNNKGFRYIINKLYQTFFTYCLSSIKSRFHSYSTLERATYHKEHDITTGIIVECKIPKGAEYYYNSRDKEYVSNQIKVIREIK